MASRKKVQKGGKYFTDKTKPFPVEGKKVKTPAWAVRPTPKKNTTKKKPAPKKK